MQEEMKTNLLDEIWEDVLADIEPEVGLELEAALAVEE